MTPANVITMCSVALNVPEGSLMARNRTERVAFCRHVAMSLIREVCRTPVGEQYSYDEIGKMFCDMDGGTVMHACQRIANLHFASERRILVDRLRHEAGGLPEHQFEKLQGKTVLIRNGTGELLQAKVMGLSKTAEYVRLLIDGKLGWSQSAKWHVIEVLTSQRIKSR